MSTDRELLELAAKAAGLQFRGGESFHAQVSELVYIADPDDAGGWHVWSPLADDGDALRLAVKLRISIDYDNRREQVWVYGVTTSEDYGADVAAATRRAIVRAAAELGKQK